MSGLMWSCHLLLARIVATVLTLGKMGGKEEWGKVRGGDLRQRPYFCVFGVCGDEDVKLRCSALLAESIVLLATIAKRQS